MSIAETPDSDLVQRAVGGCSQSFNALVERHFGCAYTVAYSRVAVRETAEDIAQEAFLRAYLHLTSLKEPSRFAAWICRIIRNIAADWQSRGCRKSAILSGISLDTIEESISSTQSDPRQRAAAAEELAALRRAINSLSPDLRDIVLLHYGQGVPKKEIAELLDLHPSTVGRRMEQALKLLRNDLEPALRRGAASLCESRLAARRSTSIIATVAAMSAGGKSALAAATATQTISAASYGALASSAGTGFSIAVKVSIGVAASVLLIGSGIALKERQSEAKVSSKVVATPTPMVRHSPSSRSARQTSYLGGPVTAASVARTNGPERQDPPNAADQYKALIRNEIAAIGSHPWAGIYVSSDPWGAKCHVHIAPMAGYVYESDSGKEVESIQGSVVYDNGALTLGTEGDTSSTRLLGRDRKFLPVRWGERQYLVSPQKMITFCSAVNSGSEPRTSAFDSRFLLRAGDESTSVPGLPEVPPNFRRYLLSEPALAAVTSIDEVTTYVGYGGKGYYIKTMLSLLGGMDIGLDTGLKLLSYEPRQPQQMITISESSETTSLATHICHSSNPTTPTLNWVFTTGSSNAAAEAQP